MSAALFCVKGPHAGREFPIGGHGLVIGRDPAAAQLVLNSPDVSRAHANVFVLPDGRIVVQDLQSTNGTHLLMPSGEKMRLRGDTVVSNGQRIALGSGNDLVFEVRISGAGDKGMFSSITEAAPVRKARAFVARTPKRARKYALIGFLCGIPMSYYFQSPLLQKAMSLIDYVFAVPQMLFESLFAFKSQGQRAMEQALLGDFAAILITVCVVCALIGGAAGYYVDQSSRRRR
jgi:hypothetical protein